MVQVTVVPTLGMYEVQMAASSHSESDAARSGPVPFQLWGSSACRLCFISRFTHSIDRRRASSEATSPGGASRSVEKKKPSCMTPAGSKP
jgi:hypothetical protein